MKKRVLSLMLATVMCMALAVTANAVEYDSSISRYYGTGNCSYTAYSALYADGGSRYRAATWVETMNGGKHGSKWASLQCFWNPFEGHWYDV